MRERAVIGHLRIRRRVRRAPSRPTHTTMRAFARASARVTASRVARTTPRDRTRVTTASVASTSAPRYVDTHCHLDQVLRALDLENVDEYLTLAETFDGARATLDACVTIGCSSSSFDSTARVVRRSEKMYGAYGVHPLSASEWKDAATRDRVRELLTTEPRVVALGETGLDYHRLPEAVGGGSEAEYKAAQRDAFVAQMRLARELDLPIIVHTREAEDDTLELMKAHLARNARVHVHCFTSSAALAKALLEAFPENLCLGFTGVATFKNGADVREVIAQIPLEKILLETDAPYMAPTPFRGQTAHPAMVPRIATAIAAVHGVDESIVFTTCRENTRRVYGI